MAVPVVNAEAMWNAGYNGSGVAIGVIDLFQASATHPALAPNLLGSHNFVNGADWFSAHATEVAGAAVSVDATYPGVAPGAGFWTAQTVKRSFLTTARDQTIAAETFGQGLGFIEDAGGNAPEVITMSIGIGGTDNGADQWSLALDHIVSTNGRIITVAAGNSGPTTDTISGIPPAAYNIITVGATGGTGALASEDYSNVAYYSSRGPTADGRAKPDIVAPGSLIHLPALGGAWADPSGTSFATPMVAGGAALLVDMGQTLGYNTDPKVIKSVLLNSADKLTGWSHTSTQPLDYNQGAGQMDLQQALAQYSPGENDPGTVPGIGWDLHEVNGTLENMYALDAIVPAGETITATLAWNRIVTTNSENIETVIYTLDHLDNLDLFVYDENDLTTPLASSVSTIDNVEHIVFTTPTTGRYVLGVDITGGGAGDLESYALAWSASAALLLGDMNGDGALTLDDVSAFILAVIDRPLYDATYTLVDADLIGDIDSSGLLDFGDLGPFQGLFAGPASAAAVPEPSTWALTLLAFFALLGYRRRA